MPVITRQDGGLISEEMGPNQGLVHTHYLGDTRVGVSLHEDPANDEEYEGEPFSCPYCSFEADYVEGVTGDDYSYHYEPHRNVYVCDHDGCGYSNENESAVKGHYTREHKDSLADMDFHADEEEEEQEYDYSYNDDTEEYECNECEYSHEEESHVKRHYTIVHRED